MLPGPYSPSPIGDYPPVPEQQPASPAPQPVAPPPAPETPTQAVQPPVQEPAQAPSPPTPETPETSETPAPPIDALSQQRAELERREADLRERESAGVAQTFEARLQTHLQQEYQKHIQAGWSPDAAAYTVGHLERGIRAEFRTDQQMKAVKSEYESKQQVAAELSDESGLSMKELMAYSTADDMRRAATQASKYAQLSARMAQLEQAVGNNQAPPQNFQEPGTPGVQQMSDRDALNSFAINGTGNLPADVDAMFQRMGI